MRVIEGALGGKQPVSHKLEMPSTRGGDTHSLTSTAGRAAQQWGFGDVVRHLHSFISGSFVSRAV